MEIRKFRSAYDLELIPASHEAITLGDLVWDSVFGPPDFTRDGMPNTIFTAFLDAGLIDRESWQQLRDESRQTQLDQAHFATRTVDVNVEFISEFQHPKIGVITGEIKALKISKFTFGDLLVRRMGDLLRIRIDRLIEQMKATRWSEYDGSIRRVFMITELYYGTIKLVVEKQYSAALDSLLSRSAIDALSRAAGNFAVEYEFSHDNVPFAMRIERVRNFNG